MLSLYFLGTYSTLTNLGCHAQKKTTFKLQKMYSLFHNIKYKVMACLILKYKQVDRGNLKFSIFFRRALKIPSETKINSLLALRYCVSTHGIIRREFAKGRIERKKKNSIRLFFYCFKKALLTISKSSKIFLRFQCCKFCFVCVCVYLCNVLFLKKKV